MSKVLVLSRGHGAEQQRGRLSERRLCIIFWFTVKRNCGYCIFGIWSHAADVRCDLQPQPTRNISPLLVGQKPKHKRQIYVSTGLGDPPLRFPEDPPHPECWTLEGEIARDCGASSAIYTCESQFARQPELQASSAGLAFLKSLNVANFLRGS